MIFGIGTDIVDVIRIEKSIAKFGERFLIKNFSDSEIKIGNALKNNGSYYAKRFAAKEAFAKAIGTGIGVNAAFKDISTLNNDFGAPYIVLKGAAKQFIADLAAKNAGKEVKLHISLTDEKQYAQAFVIIELV